MKPSPREIARYWYKKWLEIGEFTGRPVNRLSERVIALRILIASFGGTALLVLSNSSLFALTGGSFAV